MKRTLLALLVGLSLLLSLAACGSERASAQEVTEQGLAALRDLDVLALPQYWNTDGLNLDDLGDLTQAGEEVDLSAEDTAALAQAMTRHLSWQVISAQEDPGAGTASVTVSLTNLDMAPVVGQFLQEAFSDALSSALQADGQQPTEEEMTQQYLQTLTDLLTIKREKGRLDSLVVGCCGDLKFGRTVHSLIGAMSRYKNVRFVLISPEELRVPESVRTDLLEKQGIEYMETTSLEEAMPQLDILYMTRVQRERFFNEDDYVRLKDSYILTPDKLRTAKWDLAILHPLPRVNEISIAIDDDPRACYFRQVLCGKFIRMALILKLLEVE